MPKRSWEDSEDRVIPSEARNLDLRREDRPQKARARFLAEFTLSTQSEILRFAQDDSEGLGMTTRFKCR